MICLERIVFLLVTSVRHDEVICSYQTLLNKSNFKTEVQGFVLALNI